MIDDEERMRRAAARDAQEKRAMDALDAILTGRGDLGDETLRLSNEFTDRQTTRFTTWLRRFRPPRYTLTDD